METKWYTVKVQSNREKLISDRIKLEMNRGGTDVNVVVPMEKVFFARNGKKVHKEKIMYPGYIFVETSNLSILQDALKFVPGTSGILKSKSGEPSLLKKEEIDKIIFDVNKPEKTVDLYNFVIGEDVIITEGPFSTFKGTIDEITKGKVRVSVKIFGRVTPVELHSDQIEKILE